MSKYNWNFTPEDKAENVKATEPKEVEKALAPLTGEQVAEIVADGIRTYHKEHGVTKVDRQHLMFPEAASAKVDPLLRFSKADVQENVRWSEIPADSQSRRKVLLRAFMRRVLFGVPADQSLADFGEAVREVTPLLNVRTYSSAGGSGSEGGYLIPPGFIPYLVRDIPRLSVMFPLVSVYPTGQTDSGTLPTVATNAASSWGSESTEITSTDAAFGEATFTIKRHNAIATLPLELVNDTNPAIVDTVVSLIQEAMAQERDKVISYGSGSGRPTGLYQSTGITDVSGITAVNFANLNKLLYSVDERWHNAPNFRWVFNQNVLNAISSLVDSTGQPLVRPGFGDVPSTILGKRYVVSNYLPNTAIFVGDVAKYVWFDRGDMGMGTDQSGVYFNKHQLAIKFWERVDGKYVTPPTAAMARSKILSGVTNLVTPTS